MGVPSLIPILRKKSSSTDKGVTFSNDVQTQIIPLLSEDPGFVFDDYFYSDEDLADFKYEFYCEKFLIENNYIDDEDNTSTTTEIDSGSDEENNSDEKHTDGGTDVVAPSSDTGVDKTCSNDGDASDNNNSSSNNAAKDEKINNEKDDTTNTIIRSPEKQEKQTLVESEDGSKAPLSPKKKETAGRTKNTVYSHVAFGSEYPRWKPPTKSERNKMKRDIQLYVYDDFESESDRPRWRPPPKEEAKSTTNNNQRVEYDGPRWKPQPKQETKKRESKLHVHVDFESEYDGPKWKPPPKEERRTIADMNRQQVGCAALPRRTLSLTRQQEAEKNCTPVNRNREETTNQGVESGDGPVLCKPKLSLTRAKSDLIQRGHNNNNPNASSTKNSKLHAHVDFKSEYDGPRWKPLPKEERRSLLDMNMPSLYRHKSLEYDGPRWKPRPSPKEGERTETSERCGSLEYDGPRWKPPPKRKITKKSNIYQHVDFNTDYDGPRWKPPTNRRKSTTDIDENVIKLFERSEIGSEESESEDFDVPKPILERSKTVNDVVIDKPGVFDTALSGDKPRCKPPHRTKSVEYDGPRWKPIKKPSRTMSARTRSSLYYSNDDFIGGDW